MPSLQQKAEQIFEEAAQEHMIQWNNQAFKENFSLLHKTIIASIKSALIDQEEAPHILDDLDEKMFKEKESYKPGPIKESMALYKLKWIEDHMQNTPVSYVLAEIAYYKYLKNR